MASETYKDKRTNWMAIKKAVDEINTISFHFSADKGTGVIRCEDEDIILVDDQLKEDGVVLFFNIQCFMPAAVKVSLRVDQVVKVYTGDVFYKRKNVESDELYFGADAEYMMLEDQTAEHKASFPIESEKEIMDMRALQEFSNEGWVN